MYISDQLCTSDSAITEKHQTSQYGYVILRSAMT